SWNSTITSRRWRPRSGGVSPPTSVALKAGAREARPPGLPSPEQVVEHGLPFRHQLVGLFRREEVDAKTALLRLERGVEGCRLRMRREIIGVAKDLLAFLRDDEIDQQFGRVGVRRALVDSCHVER